METKSITVYSTVTCPYCRLLKEWFEKNKVSYKNIFVDQDDKAADHMIKLSGQMGVPVTEIVDAKNKSHVVVGFDRARIAKLLDIKE